MRPSRFASYWAPVIGWLLLIFIGSTDVLSAANTSRFLIPLLYWLDPHLSITALLAIQLVVRKLGHLIEYAVLAALLWRALRSGTNVRLSMSFLVIAVLLPSAIFAMSDEFHQSFVASRTALPSDVMIDIAGALIGLAICWMFARRKSGIAPRA